ncbi:MAG TPA: NRDE family protein [Flavobacterium sp.]|uniref:NRDE family protein n=1 Tax=Flavobacterium sp. TaxID=239 RepID=UPI002F3E5D82
MCTVSFVKSLDKIIITSNRDEKVIRPCAIPPQNYIIKGKNVIFPKDPKAGGTWYVVDEKGTVLVLLNGATEKHLMKPPYRKSRGLIVLDLIGSDSPKDLWGDVDLFEIEPFTLVLFQDQQLFQLRWNGEVKETTELDCNARHIWSSSTLYSEGVRKQRSDAFYSFLDNNAGISENEMYGFHRYTEAENLENGLVINRNNELKTLSITQSVIEKNKVAILHYDLVSQKDDSISFIII